MRLEDLFPLIFPPFVLPFLAKEDVDLFKHTCTYFNDEINQISPKLSLHGENYRRYFIDENYRLTIHQKLQKENLLLVLNQAQKTLCYYGCMISKPLNPKSFMNDLKLHLDFKDIAISFRFPKNQIFHLSLDFVLFFFLCHLPNYFRANDLRLFGFRGNYGIQIAQWIEPYLTRATDSLFLSMWPKEVIPRFCSSLKYLTLHQCDESIFNSVFPPLKKLAITQTQVKDWSKLPFIKEIKVCTQCTDSFKSIKCQRLTLEEVYQLNPRDFNDIEDLALINCAFITDFRDECYGYHLKRENNTDDDQDDEEEELRELREQLPNEMNYFQNLKYLTMVFAARSTTLYLDLSKSSTIRCCKLDMSKGSFRGPLASEMIPPSLETMHLTKLPFVIDFRCFSTLLYIYLVSCHEVSTLVGLERVLFVYLEDIVPLQSLTGLTKHNKRVTVRLCNNLEDFTAIRYNSEVIIDNCHKLCSGIGLEFVQSLTIKKCKALTDISMLGNVACLKLENCPWIYGYENLENISCLIIENCENLTIKEHVIRRILAKPLSECVIGEEDLFSCLPDCIYAEIFKFLPLENIYSFLSSSSNLYVRFMKQNRMINLSEFSFGEFFSNPSFRRKALNRIETPGTQIQCEVDVHFIDNINCNDLTNIEFKKLSLNGKVLLALMGQEVYYNDKTSEVTPYSPYHNYSFNILKKDHLLRISDLIVSYICEIKLLEYLHKMIVQSLTLKNWQIPLHDLILPKTLISLSLQEFCSDMIEISSPLPELRTLKCKGCLISNISDFTTLEEVILQDLNVVDVACVKHVRKVTLSNIKQRIENLTALQENEEVSILKCPIKRIDCSRSFCYSRKITILLTSLSSEIVMDFSYYKKMEFITLIGNETILTHPGIDENDGKVLTQLKLVSFTGIVNHDNNRNQF